ncbi:MAG: PspC domain-containing protein [Gammaproteobacteria bacterium]|nr:PspC domain-containing protein [Gammaproteobacteria bacterium]MDP2140527.1 PspC domain-containing protein [Gammaproteobacteria bacterium]MDP2347296.1 PspC domain-containing protein [Gammaproteobacteria bacterium]
MNTNGNRFTINRENRRLLGVCAGLADYMEVPAFLIRIIFVLACLSWPTLILVYFITYWWLKKDMNSGTVRNFIAESKTADHFRNLDYRKQMYRNPRRGRLAGVCSGIADYLEVSTTVVRVVTLLSFFLFGPFTFFAYCVCWIVLEKNPNEAQFRRSKKQRRRERHGAAVQPEVSPEMVETEVRESISLSLRECSAAFNRIESRLREVEAYITSKKFRLHCEINRI